MRYFLVSMNEDSGVTLEAFEARNTKEALLHVVDVRGGFSRDDDYQECKDKSIEEIEEYLADMNMGNDEIKDLALFRADDVGEFGKDNSCGPVWTIFDFVITGRYLLRQLRLNNL